MSYSRIVTPMASGWWVVHLEMNFNITTREFIPAATMQQGELLVYISRLGSGNSDIAICQSERVNHLSQTISNF